MGAVLPRCQHPAMARDRRSPVRRQPSAVPRFAAALHAEARDWGWLGAGLWPALVVGLLAALLAWFWYGSGDGGGEQGGEAAADPAPAPVRDGGDRPPQARSEMAAADGLLVSDGQGQVLQEVKAAALSSPWKPEEDVVAEPSQELNHVLSGQPLEVEQLLPKQGATDSREHPADPNGSQAGELRLQMGHTSDGWCVMNLARACDDVCKDRSEEQPNQPAESRDLDQEEWEVLSEHLAWEEASKNGNMEDSDSKEGEQGDCPEGDLKAKRVAAVPPMFQNIHVTFRVHYFTHSDAQLLGVTGDHECLGQWHSYVPLKYDKDGFWSESISLPVDTKVEWKFILVENGKVRRWEECSNRTLVTEHEDQIVHQWWGYH